MKKRYIIATAAAILCSFTIGGYAYCKTPVKYLSLDINPSVELGVNAFNKVVSASAYNEDGETILEGQDVINSDVKDAVNTLVKSAAEEGFIADDGSTVIAVTSETDDKEDAEELEAEAQEGAIDAIKESSDTAEVIKENVALERRDEARQLGITPGKLNLIQKLQALDPTIKVEDYKDAKVKEIMKKFIELKNGAKTPDEEVTTEQDETSITDSEQAAISSETTTTQTKSTSKAKKSTALDKNTSDIKGKSSTVRTINHGKASNGKN